MPEPVPLASVAPQPWPGTPPRAVPHRAALDAALAAGGGA